jgi:PAS domain S-box-containing protein
LNDKAHMAAIVESSDNALVSKDLNSIIKSWNNAAERIFGYAAKEVIGKSITILIPPGRENEETEILERIRRGQRIEHYETVRQRKHGSLIEVSLTVSPVENAQGKIIGASKIARDITDRKRNEAQITILAREAEHRTTCWRPLRRRCTSRSPTLPKGWRPIPKAERRACRSMAPASYCAQ